MLRLGVYFVDLIAFVLCASGSRRVYAPCTEILFYKGCGTDTEIMMSQH